MTETTNRPPRHQQSIEANDANGDDNNHKLALQPKSLVIDRTPPGSRSNSGSHYEEQQPQNNNSGVSKHTFTRQQVEAAMDAPVDDDYNSSGAATVGILSSGLAWVKNQREKRRRQYLESQAEEQLRKIAQAELKEGALQNSNASLDFSESSDTNIKIGCTKHSKSGEGVSGRIDLADALEEDDFYTSLQVKVEEEDGSSTLTPYILTPEQMNQIAVNVLPKTIAFCRWRRLYGLARDGDSFDSCMRTITDVQRTLMVIRTTRGAVFGGYADSPWQSRHHGATKFYGSAQACLFSVGTDKKLNVYKWTGKNRYIQLCEVSTKLLAFGGGGDDGAFGLCVEEDFQRGSSGPCDTFDNLALCDQENFDIVDLEFWEFLTVF